MKQTHLFNINHYGEIYGIRAVTKGSSLVCRLTKTNTCLKYRPWVRRILEKELINDPFLRDQLLAGAVVVINPRKEEKVKIA